MIGVYGANGFIGRHLVARLSAQSRPVRAVSRRFDPAFIQRHSAQVDFVEADLRQPLDMASTLQGIDTVVQLISTSSPGLQNAHAVADIHDNVIPHVEFLRTAVQCGVKRIVFLSSGGTVYGPKAPTPTREDSPTNPISSHGLTKLMVEKYIQMHGHVDGLSYVILRVANPYGPGQGFHKGQGLIPALLDRFHKGLPVLIYGDGSAKRDYVFIDDVIDAIEAAILLPQSDTRLVLNIGSGQPLSITEVLAAVEAASGYRLEREYITQRNTDVDISALDPSLAKRMLNWAPKTPFSEGIAETLAKANKRRP